MSNFGEALWLAKEKFERAWLSCPLPGAFILPAGVCLVSTTRSPRG